MATKAEEFDKLRAANPIRASLYYRQHQHAIERELLEAGRVEQAEPPGRPPTPHMAKRDEIATAMGKTAAAIYARSNAVQLQLEQRAVDEWTAASAKSEG